jgi:hypothetical protein
VRVNVSVYANSACSSSMHVYLRRHIGVHFGVMDYSLVH